MPTSTSTDLKSGIVDIDVDISFLLLVIVCAAFLGGVVGSIIINLLESGVL